MKKCDFFDEEKKEETIARSDWLFHSLQLNNTQIGSLQFEAIKTLMCDHDMTTTTTTATATKTTTTNRFNRRIRIRESHESSAMIKYLVGGQGSNCVFKDPDCSKVRTYRMYIRNYNSILIKKKIIIFRSR